MLKYILIGIVVIVYLIIGIIVNGIVANENKDFSFLVMLLYPIMLVMVVFFLLIDLPYKLGRKIKQKLNL